jgi:putative membrane protein
MNIIARILISAFALLLVAKIIPGIAVASIYVAVIAAFTLGILNVFVRPILIFLTLPITIITLGLFMFVINASLFMFTAYFIEGFAVDSFLTALLGSFIVSLVSAAGTKLLLSK